MPSVHVHLYHGPEMAEQEANPPRQRSAAFCPKCKRRRVQDLKVLVPVMDPETMDESAMMAAAFCGPEFRWACPCGERLYAPGFVAEGW